MAKALNTAKVKQHETHTTLSLISLQQFVVVFTAMRKTIINTSDTQLSHWPIRIRINQSINHNIDVAFCR